MKIEKNVDIPELSGRGRKPKYPFREMEVGDSIVVPGKSALASDCPAYNSAHQLGRRLGWKFAGRQEAPGKTVRIWRVA